MPSKRFMIRVIRKALEALRELREHYHTFRIDDQLRIDSSISALDGILYTLEIIEGESTDED